MFPLAIWVFMLGLSERYFIHCVLVSAVISPGAVVLCRHTYSPDLLPQFDLSRVPVVNFDQFTVLPVVCALGLVLAAVLLRYARWRTQTTLLIVRDEMEMNELWEDIKVTNHEALLYTHAHACIHTYTHACIHADIQRNIHTSR